MSIFCCCCSRSSTPSQNENQNPRISEFIQENQNSEIRELSTGSLFSNMSITGHADSSSEEERVEGNTSYQNLSQLTVPIDVYIAQIFLSAQGNQGPLIGPTGSHFVGDEMNRSRTISYINEDGILNSLPVNNESIGNDAQSSTGSAILPGMLTEQNS